MTADLTITGIFPVVKEINQKRLLPISQVQFQSRLDSLNLEPIVVKLMDVKEGEGWTLEYADQRVLEYKHFLMLNFLYPEHDFVPTHDIDCVWHRHVMDTEKYSTDCEMLYSLRYQRFIANILKPMFSFVGIRINAGLFFDHFPYFGMRGEDDNIITARVILLNILYMPLDTFKKLDIIDPETILLNEKIENEIIRFPNGELKPHNDKILDSIRQFASKINIFTFFYLSNGQKVRSYFIEPSENSNKSLIFFNRSGTGDFGKIEVKTLFTNFFSLQDLLEKGFSLVINQLHGVDGGEGLSDSCGKKDLQTFQDLYDVLKHYSGIDNKSIGMIGGSSGGLMTYISVKSFDWLIAGVIIASPVDEQKSLKERGQNLKNAKMLHYDVDNKNELIFRSPLLWTNELQNSCPLLIMHGTSDWRVDVTHSLGMASKLYENQKPFRLKIYEGADHSLREYQSDVSKEIVSWFVDFLINKRKLPNLEKHGI